MSSISKQTNNSKLGFDELLEYFEGVTGTGSQRMAKCSAHDDVQPSLSIGWRDGTVLIHCFAG